MKLHSFFNASFINDDKPQNKEFLPLEIGKIYKAKVLASKGDYLLFSVNGQVFKTSFFTTTNSFIYLRLIDSKQIFKFELIKDNIVLEQNQNQENDFIDLLKEKFSSELIENLLNKENSILNNKDLYNIEKLKEYLQNFLTKTSDKEYHSLIKIDENNYFHVEIKQNEESKWYFSLNLEFNGKKYLFVKGYYQKTSNKVNINFITNSKNIYKETKESEKELSKINPKYKWLCSQRYEEKISL